MAIKSSLRNKLVKGMKLSDNYELKHSKSKAIAKKKKIVDDSNYGKATPTSDRYHSANGRNV